MEFITKYSRVVEIAIVASFFFYSVIVNSRDVPGLKQSMAATTITVAVLQAKFEVIQKSLDRIERSLDRRREE